MSDSSVLTAESREKVGTRPSRALRSEGRIPANLQADADNAHVDFSINENEFLASRRRHVHLYDIELAGGKHSDASKLTAKSKRSAASARRRAACKDPSPHRRRRQQRSSVSWETEAYPKDPPEAT